MGRPQGAFTADTECHKLKPNRMQRVSLGALIQPVFLENTPSESLKPLLNEHLLLQGEQN